MDSAIWGTLTVSMAERREVVWKRDRGVEERLCEREASEVGYARMARQRAGQHFFHRFQVSLSYETVRSKRRREIADVKPEMETRMGKQNKKITNPLVVTLMRAGMGRSVN